MDSVLGGGVSLLLVAGVIVALALLGGQLMAVFGFRYQSAGQLVLYFLLVELISFPLDMICQGLPRALYDFKKLSRWQANTLYIPMDALCTMLAFWVADLCMDSVSATGLSLWVIAFVLALITLPVSKERPRRDDNH